MPPTVWTIGHSTRPLQDFLAVLETHGIELAAEPHRLGAPARLVGARLSYEVVAGTAGDRSRRA